MKRRVAMDVPYHPLRTFHKSREDTVGLLPVNHTHAPVVEVVTWWLTAVVWGVSECPIYCEVGTACDVVVPSLKWAGEAHSEYSVPILDCPI